MRFKTRLKINLSLLKNNYQKLKSIAGNTQTLFMVKSNAYGHGIIPIVRYSHVELGIQEFGCATLGEALTLRRELPELKIEIYVFSDLELDGEEGLSYYLDHRIIPVISNLEQLSNILNHSQCQFLPLCLKFDTGMNRLGIPHQQVAKVLQMLQASGKKNIYHLMSHFACSSQSIEKVPMGKEQYECFKNIKEFFLKEGLVIERSSMANSGAIEQGLALEETHIRPGLLLYGPTSLVPKLRKTGRWKGESISSLETHIIHLKKVYKGDPVGYGAMHCPHDGLLAYMALGYGDGINNTFSGIKINCKGIVGQIIGRISMDMAAILFPPEAEKTLSLGERILLWEHDQQSLLKLSDSISLIPYEILCGISDRIPRIYSY